MSHRKCIVITCFIVLLIAMTTGCQKEGGASEEASALLETEKETLVGDFRAKADDRVRNADKPQAADAVPSATGQKIKFPAEVRSSK